MNNSATAYFFNRRIRLSAVAALPALLAGLLAVTQPARANTYEVTNTNNIGSGSLRQAITYANNNPGADTITFALATDGTHIVLAGAAGEDANASGDLDILDGGNLTIQGNGVANTVIDGGGIDRVFHVCPGGDCANTVNLIGMVIRNGSVTGGGGGGISNHGTLNIQNSTIGENLAGNTADYGGGIYNEGGTTTVDGSTVSNNTANYGGGIYNSGSTATLNVQNTTTVGVNTATFDGGGIYNSGGTFTVNGSIVRFNNAINGGGIYNWEESSLNIQNGSIIGGTGAGNTASTDGGGIYNEGGTTTVDASTVSANDADYGGGIYNEGLGATLIIQNGSTIGGAGAGNTANPFGGGIYNESGTTTVDDSTVSANNATNGGGIYNFATLDILNGSTIGGAGAGNGLCNEGGGIYNQIGATTTVIASTVSANVAGYGGGIFSQGTLNVQNGSIIGGVGAGNLSIYNGGGIYNLAGTSTVDGSSIKDNTAGGSGGGIYNEAMLDIQNGSTIGGAGAGNTSANGPGGGIYNKIGLATVDDSTVSANWAVNGGGGGIFNAAVLYVLNGSTIGGVGAGNGTTGNGGGIANNINGMTTVTGSRILNNTATNGNGGGVFSDSNAGWVTNVTGSCIVGNSTTSFYNDQSPQQNATGNWWGAASGPNTPGADTVGGNVDTSGYLTRPILGCGIKVCLPPVLLLLLK